MTLISRLHRPCPSPLVKLQHQREIWRECSQYAMPSIREWITSELGNKGDNPVHFRWARRVYGRGAEGIRRDRYLELVGGIVEISPHGVPVMQMLLNNYRPRSYKELCISYNISKDEVAQGRTYSHSHFTTICHMDHRPMMRFLQKHYDIRAVDIGGAKWMFKMIHAWIHCDHREMWSRARQLQLLIAIDHDDIARFSPPPGSNNKFVHHVMKTVAGVLPDRLQVPTMRPVKAHTT